MIKAVFLIYLTALQLLIIIDYAVATPRKPVATAIHIKTPTITATSACTKSPIIKMSPTATRTPTATKSATATCIRTATATRTPTVTSTASYAATNTVTVTPTPTRTLTASVTPSVTYTPTIKATLVPTKIPNMQTICDAGGPYIGGENGINSLACSDESVGIQLDASRSQGTNLSYLWSTDCASAQFDDLTSVSPNFRLVTLSPEGRAVSCKVMLQIYSDEEGFSEFCEAEIVAEVCKLDCSGKLNGSSRIDSCGTCNGDNSGCSQCASEDLSSKQLALDGNGAKLKNIALKLAAEVNNAGKVLKLNAKQLALEKQFIDAARTKATNFYVQFWTETYTLIPSVARICDKGDKCINQNLESSFIEIKNGTLNILSVVKSLNDRLHKLKRRASTTAAKSKLNKISKKSNKLLKDAQSIESLNQVLINSMPNMTSSGC